MPFKNRIDRVSSVTPHLPSMSGYSFLIEEFSYSAIRHSRVVQRLNVVVKFFLLRRVFLNLLINKLVRFYRNAETEIVRKLGVFYFIS